MEKNKKVDVESSEEYFNKDTMIKIGSKYFWRDSEDITLVNTSKGQRYRRKLSPLIRRLEYNGLFTDIVDIVVNKSGMELSVTDPEVIKVDGDYTLKRFCIKAEDGSYQLIAKNHIQLIHGGMCHKDDAVELGKMYVNKKSIGKGGPAYATADRVTLTKHAGYILNEDITESMDDATAEIIEVHHKQISRNHQVFKKFREYNSGNERRIRVVSPMVGWSKKNYTYIENSNTYVHKNMLDEYIRLSDAFRDRNIRDEVANVKKRMNDGYSDAGTDENNSNRISMDYGTQGGGIIFFKAQMPKKYSATKSKTGGLGYTFGIEIETSAGQMTDQKCSDVQLDKVGDRSIGAYEYVSGVLHGDNGMKSIEGMCKALAKSTFVDDRCSIHIHVGGDTKSPLVETPKFTKGLSIALISLGAQIEDDLYAMNPPSRNKGLKHCASISRWGKITPDNHDNLLGSFLFGGNADGVIADRQVNSNALKYSKHSSRYKTTTSKWIGARYKWLNLLNLHTARGFKTVEVRMWAGSTSYEKIKNYVLLSLALVSFAENHQGRIFEIKPVTIEEIVETVYSKKAIIKKSLLKFVKERTNKFKEVRKQLN